MPKIDLNENEITTITSALDMAMKSAHRAQTASKTPQIREVYLAHERMINDLALKLKAAK